MMCLGEENILHSDLERSSWHLEGAEIQLAALMERYSETSSWSAGAQPPSKSIGRETGEHWTNWEISKYHWFQHLHSWQFGGQFYFYSFSSWMLPTIACEMWRQDWLCWRHAHWPHYIHLNISKLLCFSSTLPSSISTNTCKGSPWVWRRLSWTRHFLTENSSRSSMKPNIN